MTLQQFREDTALLPGDTELLIIDYPTGLPVACSFFIRDDLDEQDELRDQLDPDALVMSEEAS